MHSVQNSSRELALNTRSLLQLLTLYQQQKQGILYSISLANIPDHADRHAYVQGLISFNSGGFANATAWFKTYSIWHMAMVLFLDNS
ncbi:hypothetical protein SLA2020_481570 [Shorea laevis]